MRRIIVVLLVGGQAWLMAQQAPTFKSSTLLVVQNVTVKDRQGNLIEGLAARDFVVTEDGVPQPIAFVEYQRLSAPPIGATDITPAVPARSTSTVPAVTAVGDTLNAVPIPGDHRYRGKRLIVLYLDLQALSFFNESRVFEGVRKYLARHITAVDVVSVFVYQNSRVRMRQDFTDDREALRQLVDAIERESIELEQFGPGIEFETGGQFGEDGGTFNMFEMDRRLSALQTTISNLGPLPERKTLVYFGGNLGTTTENLAQMRATVNAAVRSNVTINPVDPAGLTAGAPLGNATRLSPGGVAMFSGQIAQRAVTREQSQQDVYYALAKDTGGVATLNNNDLSMGIASAANAVTGYYMIGYYVTNAAKDGRFRRVRVTLGGTLDAGAELSYRSGYYAAKEWARFNSYDKERHLEEALRLEDPVTDIPMAIEVNYFQVSGAEYFVPVSVRMPGSELTRPRPAGETRAVIDVIAEVKDEYGVTMRNSRDKLEFRLDAAAAAETARRPIQYEGGFSLLPGNYAIKVLARDQTTGRIGTFIHRFTVPNLEREKARLPISTVVLSTQRVAPADALDTVRQKIAATVSNPLMHDGLQLIPSVTRTFSAGQPLFIYLQAYEREAEAPRPLIAFATFYRDGMPAFETGALGVETWDPKTRALPIRLGVAAGQLTPGQYDCQVTVLDPGANRAAHWRAAIVVLR